MEGREDDQDKEVWTPIPRMPHYLVSNLGRIKNSKNKLLKPFLNKWGYELIDLCQYGHKYRRSVHRVVMEAFVGPSSKAVNHKDTVKTNNRLENLEYVTWSENELHSWKNGKTSPKSGAKIKESDAQSIRRRRVAGEEGSKLAVEFGISPQTICDVYKKRVWR